MRKWTIQVFTQDPHKPAERISAVDLEYNNNGIVFYEEGAPNVRLFTPYSSVRLISRVDA